MTRSVTGAARAIHHRERVRVHHTIQAPDGLTDTVRHLHHNLFAILHHLPDLATLLVKDLRCPSP